MNTIEGNKLIAEFMGLHFHKVGWVDATHIDGNYEQRYLAYHSSWDWLMPVVKKIRKLDPSSNFIEYEKWWDLISNSIIQNYEISEVFPFVVAFIQWYNKEQSVKESDTSKAT